MKYANFLSKLLCLALIAVGLWQYQRVALSREALVAEHEALAAEINAYNAELLAEETASPYADGTYEGTATGFGGDITLSLTVTDGAIAEITVISAAGEDPAYYSQAEGVLAEIVAAQSVEVDTVSGATYSSRGLIEAAAQALEKAVK